jgi:hypothetical protein
MSPIEAVPANLLARARSLGNNDSPARRFALARCAGMSNGLRPVLLMRLLLCWLYGKSRVS